MRSPADGSRSNRAATAALVLTLGFPFLAACGGDDTPAPAAETSVDETAGGAETTGAALETVDVAAFAAGLVAKPDAVVIDVRTEEEFGEGHLDGADQIDFYAADFKEQLADLDRDISYYIYCHSGNRSGQALAMMTELGFTDVTNLDGGIMAWAAAGEPIVN